MTRKLPARSVAIAGLICVLPDGSLIRTSPLSGVPSRLNRRPTQPADPSRCVSVHATKIVPVGDSLIIEATLRSEDIGFVYVGQPATVKIDTYDFTKFGELEGTVEAISADSEKDERTGLFLYTVTVRTNKTHLGPTESEQPVIPGMQTTVDIVIGKRTILAFLTDRLRQTAATAFNQR